MFRDIQKSLEKAQDEYIDRVSNGDGDIWENVYQDEEEFTTTPTEWYDENDEIDWDTSETKEIFDRHISEIEQENEYIPKFEGPIEGFSEEDKERIEELRLAGIEYSQQYKIGLKERAGEAGLTEQEYLQKCFPTIGGTLEKS
jgi:hypothetical protein